MDCPPGVNELRRVEPRTAVIRSAVLRVLGSPSDCRSEGVLVVYAEGRTLCAQLVDGRVAESEESTEASRQLRADQWRLVTADMRKSVMDVGRLTGRGPGEVQGEVTELMGKVLGSREAEDGRAGGPAWLADLALRLVAGHPVVYVAPACCASQTVEMLLERGVQAFVEIDLEELHSTTSRVV